jgi:hypothetical protein
MALSSVVLASYAFYYHRAPMVHDKELVADYKPRTYLKINMTGDFFDQQHEMEGQPWFSACNPCSARLFPAAGPELPARGPCADRW